MFKPFKYSYEVIQIMYHCEATRTVKIILTPFIILLAVLIGILNFNTEDIPHNSDKDH